jgi:pyrroloquinoline-quinone synthase
MTQAVADRVDALVASRRLLDHPFYVAWSKGALTRKALQVYAEQYYQWVYAFATWLSAAHSNATDFAMRQEILANLMDEEHGADNHPELWLRFCDALGLDRERVKGAEPLPETREAVETMRRVCRESPAAAALAAIYAYESQQPEVMKVKREGLREMYGVTEGHDYFRVHETMDVAHRAAERRLLEAHAPAHERAALTAAEEALDATYRLLDGVERLRTT